MANSTTTGASSPQDQLEKMRRELETERRRTRRITNLGLILAVLILVGLGAYFYYGYEETKTLTPDRLIDYVQVYVEEKIPEARRLLENEVKKNAKPWAEELSKEALKSFPTLRSRLEDVAMDQYKQAVSELTTMTDQEFRRYLRQNRKTLQDLAEKPETADTALAELERSLEAETKGSLIVDAKKLLDTLIAANAKLRRLAADGKDLSAEEQNERRVFMIAKRLQQMYVPGDLNVPISPRTSTGIPPSTTPSKGEPKVKADTVKAPIPPRAKVGSPVVGDSPTDPKTKSPPPPAKDKVKAKGGK